MTSSFSLQELPPYLIGIDLGTSRSYVSYVDLDRKKNPRGTVKLFSMQQLSSLSMIEEQSCLPSYIYLPKKGQLAKTQLALPWNANIDYAVGEFAQRQASDTPFAVASSAKSWLAHHSQSAKEELLPPFLEEGARKISPFKASQCFLEHIRDSWNHQMAKGNPEFLLEEQHIVITVPASFDEVSRQSTLEAARKASYKHVFLLEEPLAAFYECMASQSSFLEKNLKHGEHILVCDLGGGTCDFSLIRVGKEENKLSFERSAVGAHLLLGGDNMDLSLAHEVEKLFLEKQGKKLSKKEFLQVLSQCRDLKESIFLEKQESVRIFLEGTGASLLKGSSFLDLCSSSLRGKLLAGFFPKLSFQEASRLQKKQALRSQGLPYEADPAITKHLASFLAEQKKQYGCSILPNWVLFHGGVMNAGAFRSSIMESLEYWFSNMPEEGEQDLKLQKARFVKELPCKNYDWAVSKGAGEYAKSCYGMGQKVKANLPRSYYLLLKKQGQWQALTLLAKSSSLPVKVTLDLPLHLKTNTPVQFQLLSSETRLDDCPGQFCEYCEEEFKHFPPMNTFLSLGKGRKEQKEIQVLLDLEYDELGILHLSLQAKDKAYAHMQWKIEFQSNTAVGFAENFSAESRKEHAKEKMQLLLEDQDKLEFVQILQELLKGQSLSKKSLGKMESFLSLRKNHWPPGILRLCVDELLSFSCSTTQSFFPSYLNFLGFCMRPGLGQPLDNFRVKSLWQLSLQLLKKTYAHDLEVQKLIFFRRIAGGLHSGQQLQVFQSILEKIFETKKMTKIKKHLNPYEYQESMRLLVSLEAISTSHKKDLVNFILKQAKEKESLEKEDYWVLMRLLARRLIFSSISFVLPSEFCLSTLKEVLKFPQSDKDALFFLLQATLVQSEYRHVNVDIDEAKELLEPLKAADSRLEADSFFLEKQSQEIQERILLDSLPSALLMH